MEPVTKKKKTNDDEPVTKSVKDTDDLLDEQLKVCKRFIGYLLDTTPLDYTINEWYDDELHSK